MFPPLDCKKERRMFLPCPQSQGIVGAGGVYKHPLRFFTSSPTTTTCEPGFPKSQMTPRMESVSVCPKKNRSAASMFVRLWCFPKVW
jgi:hypothetical protein